MLFLVFLPCQFIFVHGLCKALVEGNIAPGAAGVKDAWVGFFPLSFALRKQANIVRIKEKKSLLCKICSELRISLWFNHLRTDEIFCWEVVLSVFVFLALVQ